MHSREIVSGPEVEPITVAEARTHLNFSSTSKDSELSGMITAFRIAIENYLNRVLINQSWKVYYNRWANELLIPFGSLSTVTSVKYYDTSGTQQTLTENDYYWVRKTVDPGRIVRKYDATYPELQYGRPDAIEIAFTAGYGAAATAIPDDIRHALKVMLTDYFEHKGSIVVDGGRVTRIPGHITNLIHSYKLYQF